MHDDPVPFDMDILPFLDSHQRPEGVLVRGDGVELAEILIERIGVFPGVAYDTVGRPVADHDGLEGIRPVHRPPSDEKVFRREQGVFIPVHVRAEHPEALYGMQVVVLCD